MFVAFFVYFVERNMNCHAILTSWKNPDMKIINTLDFLILQNLLPQLFTVQVTWLLFHQNADTLFEYWNSCHHDNYRENICANWINDFVFGPNSNDNSSNYNSNRLKHVSCNMDDSSSHIDVLLFVSFFFFSIIWSSSESMVFKNCQIQNVTSKTDKWSNKHDPRIDIDLSSIHHSICCFHYQIDNEYPDGKNGPKSS